MLSFSPYSSTPYSALDAQVEALATITAESDINIETGLEVSIENIQNIVHGYAFFEVDLDVSSSSKILTSNLSQRNQGVVYYILAIDQERSFELKILGSK